MLLKKYLPLILCFILCCQCLPASGAEYVGCMEVLPVENAAFYAGQDITAPITPLSAGTILRDCWRITDEWVYGHLQDAEGFVPAACLAPTEGMKTFSAMVALAPAALYETPTEATELCQLPAGAVIMECVLAEEGWVQGVFGGYTGYARLDACTPYAALDAQAEIPRPFLLATDMSNRKMNYAPPRPFTVEWDYEGESSIRLVPKGSCSALQLLSMEYHSEENNSILFTFTAETLAAEFTPTDNAITLQVPFFGLLPNIGLSYLDEYGQVHFCAVSISGRDGSLVVTEL